MAKPGRKKLKDPRKYWISVRLTRSERNRIRLLAQLYAGGEESLWLRYAALHARPKILKKTPGNFKKRSPR